jgi:hypothetical protein
MKIGARRLAPRRAPAVRRVGVSADLSVRAPRAALGPSARDAPFPCARAPRLWETPPRRRAPSCPRRMRRVRHGPPVRRRRYRRTRGH